MSGETLSECKFQAGGTLNPHALSYVLRQADTDIYKWLKNGEFCYVLNSRQMGKSSLLSKAMYRLQKDEIAVCGWIDLQGIGTGSAEQLYYGIIHRLTQKKEGKTSTLQNYLNSDWSSWWNERQILSPVHRLREWIEEILLGLVTKKKIIIFIDEIDQIRKLSDTANDFLSLIRFFFNGRANNAKYRNITFVLCGVAKPSDLIQNSEQSPFNIGRGIELTPLKLANTKNLSEVFNKQAEKPSNVIKEIFKWTNGQPFLTQQIGQLIVEDGTYIPEGEESRIVKQQVMKEIIEHWQDHDDPPHLTTIRDRLLFDNSGKLRRLELCHKIIIHGKIKVNDNPEEASESLDLRLTGLVIKKEQSLTFYNQIYRHIFNQSWIENEFKNCRPHNEKLLSWLASNKQDQSQLLYGDELKKIEEWKEGKRLGDDDHDFLGASSKFCNRAEGFLSRANDYTIAIRRILSWTNGKEDLNEIIFKIAANFFESPKERGDAEWIDHLVRRHLIEDWETKDHAIPLRKIRDYLLRNQKCDPFWLLFRYQQVLKGQLIKHDCLENQELLKSGLLVKKDGELIVHNRIYESVFDLTWVTKELTSLRPYANELTAWLNSGCQDESKLLRGKILEDSLASINSQSLRKEEDNFLITSQVVNLRGI